MALPTTISGISTAVACAGPYKIAAGDYPVVAIDTAATGGAGNLTGTGSTIAYGQTFTVGGANLVVESVTVSLFKSGTPTDNVYCEITATDTAGTVLATSSNQIACSSLSASTVDCTFNFSSPPTITAAATFGVVFRRTGGGDASNFPRIQVGLSSTYAGGAGYNFNGTSWVSGNDLDVYVSTTVTLASDTFYIIGKNSSTASNLTAQKATDPTSSFSAVASCSFSGGDVRNFAAFQDGTTIHVAVMGGPSSTSVLPQYATFNMATDTWSSAQGILGAAMDPTTSAGAATDGISIVARSDGTVVVFYSGVKTSSMGTSYSRVVYARRTAVGTWSLTNQAVDVGGAFNFVTPEAILGASNSIHFIVCYGGTGILYTRTLNSSDALQTASSNIGAGSEVPEAQGISYDVSGTRKVVVAWQNGSSIAGTYFDSANTPTTGDTTVEGSSTQGRLFVDTGDSNKVWVLYRFSTDSDLYVENSTNHGSTFGSKTSAFTGTVASAKANLSIDGAIYQRGSNVVIPYVVNDGGTLKYNEYVVRTTGVTGTMAAPETADDATFAGDVVLAGVTGELVVAETADDATLTGSVAWLGTLAAPETADDATITASVAWNAILAAPETADDATFAGAVAWNAVLDADETADDATITGGIYGTGELDADETADDATITATVAWAAILAATETADDATLDGTVEWLPATGTMAAPETADDATFAGAVAWNTVLNAFETADDATLDGSAAWLATLAATETADDATFDGAVAWTAVLAATEAADDATFDGQVIAETITGELAVTEAADDATFDGEVTLTPATGELDADEAADDATMAGSVAWLATLAATEAADDATLDGSVAWLATLAATETADDATISGSVAWLATLAVGETADDATFAGSVAWLATLAANETADDATFAGSVAWLATLAATETADDATFTGGIYGTGTLGAPETADDATFTGGIYGTGTLVVSEAADDATFAGEIVGEGVTGALDADEAADDATVTGEVTGNVGALAASETADDATLTGTTGWSGTLAANETADAAAISGSVAWAGILAATEAVDDATFDAGIVSWVAILSATEAQDSAAFAGETAAVPAQVVFTAVETPDGAAFLGKVPERVILPFVTPRDYGWYDRKHVKKLYRKG